MHKSLSLLFLAVPAIVSPVSAQAAYETLSVSEFVQAQMNLLRGLSDILNSPDTARDPQKAAISINAISNVLASLATAKPEATMEEIAALQTELGDEPKQVAIALQQALQKIVSHNFYNSPELQTAVMNFAVQSQQLQR